MTNRKTAVYVCAWGCDTPLDRRITFLTGDAALPRRVCGPLCRKRPEGATCIDRVQLDEALTALVDIATL